MSGMVQKHQRVDSSVYASTYEENCSESSIATTDADSFDSLDYERLDMEQFKSEWHACIEILKHAESYKQVKKAVCSIDEMKRLYETSRVLVEIYHTMNTHNTFYKEEQNWFDSVHPDFDILQSAYAQAVSESAYVDNLCSEFGNEFTTVLLMQSQLGSEELKNLSELELKLSSQYSQLLASLSAEKCEEDDSAADRLQGEMVSLRDVVSGLNSSLRTERKQNARLLSDMMMGSAQRFDSLYDDLVHIRHSISIHTGEKNFIPIGYRRMSRTAYDPDACASFRRQILEYAVPAASRRAEGKSLRMGIDQLTVYDQFAPADAGERVQADGGTENLLTLFSQIFAEMHPLTDAFFQDVLKYRSFDLEKREGKIIGAYSNFVPACRMPFIFQTYDGSAGSVRTFVHECGHGFQSYLCRDFQQHDLMHASADLAEVHSISMEFFTWPWMELMFPGRSKHYFVQHLDHVLFFIPYGTAVDEFQHAVYEKPYMTSEERRSFWQHLEEKYLPFRWHDDIPFYQEGRRWQLQTHIYRWPFYYIDYVLAHICALQFFHQCMKGTDFREKAFSSYVELCRLGGTKSFTDALAAADLEVPFQEGIVRKAIGSAETGFDQQ